MSTITSNSNSSGGCTGQPTFSDFQGCVVSHPILATIYTAVMDIVKTPCGTVLAEIFGPTGVGKSTLVRRVAQDAAEHHRLLLTDNPGAVPVIRVEAPAPESGTFNWRDFYIRSLDAFEEPLVHHKVKDPNQGTLAPYARRIARANGSELKRAFEHCVRYRGTRLIIIDEAQHLAKAGNSRRLLDHMDTIKSLAASTGSLFLMVGTYELLDLLELNGQLARRSTPKHFQRYLADKLEHVKAFKNILNTFQKNLPVQCEFSFTDHYGLFYKGSLGCVGLLKNWLDRAVARVLQQKENCLRISHLRQDAYAPRSLLQITKEITEGEQRRAREESCSEEIDRLLGFLPGSEHRTDDVAPASKNRRPPVGQRSPVRDPVGTL